VASALHSRAGVSFFAGKRIVVTGASGLLGRALVDRLLAGGALVRAVVHRRSFAADHPRLDVVHADLTHQDDCDRVMADMDAACLCASITVGAAAAVRNPMLAVTSNLVIAARSLQAASVARVERVLVVSSSTVYPAYARPVSEEEAADGEPHAAYQGVGHMKRYVETLARFYADRYGVRAAIVRPVPFYGPHDDFDLETCHVIPALIRKAVAQQDPFEIWGTGRDVRDFMHVRDVARGALLALEHAADCDPINLGSGAGVSVLELAEMIRAIAGCGSPLLLQPSQPSTIPVRLVDVSKARARLGFSASITLHDGLQETIDWFAANRPHERAA
jgi:GDP-L-fucose synthase